MDVTNLYTHKKEDIEGKDIYIVIIISFIKIVNKYVA